MTDAVSLAIEISVVLLSRSRDPLTVPLPPLPRSGRIEMSSGVWRGRARPAFRFFFSSTADRKLRLETCMARMATGRQVPSETAIHVLEGTEGWAASLRATPGPCSYRPRCRPRYLPPRYLQHRWPTTQPQAALTARRGLEFEILGVDLTFCASEFRSIERE